MLLSLKRLFDVCFKALVTVLLIASIAFCMLTMALGVISGVGYFWLVDAIQLTLVMVFCLRFSFKRLAFVSRKK